MAITKLLRIKETSGRSKTKHLKNNIYYICRDSKTDNGRWIGGNAGATPEQILSTMKRNKEAWNKEKGSQAFHYMLSFSPDEKVDEELAMQISQEFCAELFGEEYYHVIAVHNDTNHMHSHITFDSVCRLTGLKFHSPRGDWAKRIQPITDKLCKKYRLKTLSYDPEHKDGKDYGTWEKEKKEQREDGSNRNTYTWNDIIRDDIDEAIANCDTWNAFIKYLKNQKYEIKQGQYISIKPYGKERFVRVYRLGKGYSPEEIQRRMEMKEKHSMKEGHSIEKEYKKANHQIGMGKNDKFKINKAADFKTYGDWKYVAQIFKIKKSKNKDWKLNPFQKQFYNKWYFTYFIRKPGYSQTWKYKKDILRVEKLAKQLAYIIDHDIQSYDDIQVRKQEAGNQQKEMKQQKRNSYLKGKKKYLFFKVKEYLKIESELKKFPKNTRSDLSENLEHMKQEVEKIMPMEKALICYQESKESVIYYNEKINKLKDEIKILGQIEDADLTVAEMKPDIVVNRRNSHIHKEEKQNERLNL